MAYTSSRSLCASAAITAVLALGSIPAMAQEAAPSLELPQTVTAPSATAPVVVPPAPTATAPTVVPTTTPVQPTVVLPDVSSAPAAEASGQPAQTRSAQIQPTQRTSGNATRATAAPVAAPAQTQSATDMAPVAPLKPQIGDTLNSAPVAEANSASGNAVPADAAPSEEGNGAPVGAIAGVLALLALGAGGIAAMRSRRRSQPEPAVQPARSRVEPEPVIPVTGHTPATAPVAATPAYAYAPAAATTYAPTAKATYKPVAAHGAHTDRGVAPATQRDNGFAMPEGPVPTGEARQQLLRDMVAAKPDAANPFLSPSYRRKRARVILQHREYMQREHADQFDWRTYRPSTRTSTPVKPSLVDA